jgi:small multidrug resistance family-3 protein
MTVLRSILLFAVAALAEIGGAWLVWQGVREHRGLVWQGVREHRGLIFVGAGILALGAYGFVATFLPTPTSDASWPPTAGCSWPVR